MSGNGCPVTNSPTDMYICMNACKVIDNPIPIMRNAGYESSHFLAIIPHLNRMVMYSNNTNIPPAKPSSSMMMA